MQKSPLQKKLHCLCPTPNPRGEPLFCEFHFPINITEIFHPLLIISIVSLKKIRKRKKLDKAYPLSLFY